MDSLSHRPEDHNDFTGNHHSLQHDDDHHALPPLKKSVWPKIFLFLFLLCAAVGGYLAYDVYSFIKSPASSTPQEIVITITPGSSLERVSQNLKKISAISDVTRFKLLAKYHKDFGTIKAGDFALNTGWTPTQVLWQITNGQPLLDMITIREGLTWWETAKILEEQGFATYEDFKKVIHDPTFLRNNNIPFANAEGFLFPETYKLRKPKKMTPQSAEFVAKMLVSTFWQKTKPVWTKLPLKEGVTLAPVVPTTPTTSGNATGATNSSASATPATNGTTSTNSTANTNSTIATNGTGSTNGTTTVQLADPLPHQIDSDALARLVILASLVEKETGVPAERPRVAGVYSNRLRDNMLLQCDPTIIYGVGESFSGSIRRSQIQDAKNLYNTYQHAGLPPGPISSFGASSFSAAFAPEEHDYIYFVATGIDKGHTFSKTLEEHNRAVAVYRKNIRNKP